MSGPAVAEPLLRADAPRRGTLPVRPAAGPVASERAAKTLFVVLQAWILVSVSCADEHFAAVGALHLRPVLGVLGLAAAFAQGLQRHAERGGGPFLRYAPSTWMVAVAATAGLSTIWAFDTSLAKTALIEYADALGAFVLFAVGLRTPRQIRITLVTLSIASGVFLLLSLWEWHGGRYDFTMNVVRMMGAGSRYADPNSFGATLAFALPFVIWTGVHGRSRLLAFGALVFAGLTVYCIFKTSSRSAMVLLVLSSMIGLALLPGRRARVAALALLVAGAVVMAATLSRSQTKRLASIVAASTYEHEESTRGRIVGYAIACKMFEDRPAVGVGPGNWSAYRSRKLDGNKLMPHSLTGILLGTRGALGTLAFLGLLGSTLALAVRERRRWNRGRDRDARAMRALAFTVIGVLGLLLVSGLGAHNVARPNWYFAAGLIVAMAGCRRASPWAEETS